MSSVSTAVLGLTLAALSLATPAVAADSHQHGGHDHRMASEPAAAKAHGARMSEGTIKKIDKAAGKVTISHGPLENLGMPPMTMVFRVSDAALLDRVEAGDKVRFTAEKSGAAYTVVALEPVK